MTKRRSKPRRQEGDLIIRVEQERVCFGSDGVVALISQREQGQHPWEVVGQFNLREATELHRKLGDVLKGWKKRCAVLEVWKQR